MGRTEAYRGRNPDSYLDINVAGSSDVTLTETQATPSTIRLTGARTNTGTVRAPIDADDRVRWIVENACTGDFDTYFGVVGGNSAYVPQGGTVQVYARGTVISQVGAFVGRGSVQYAEVTLGASQVKALAATPALLVPAPGARRMLEFFSALLLLDYGGSNVFAANGAGISVAWVSGTSTLAATIEPATGWVDGNSDRALVMTAAPGAVVLRTSAENAPLYLVNVIGPEITGNAANDNAIRIQTRYAVRAAW